MRHCTPWKTQGRKPLPQRLLPPVGSVPPETRTTKPGRSWFSRAQAVGDPRAHRGVAGALVAGEQQHLGGGVVELVGPHRVDDRHVVDDRGEVRQQLADPRAALAVLGELVGRAEELGRALDEGEPLALEDFLGAGRAVELVELGLVVEQVVLRRRAGHVQVDDPLGLGRQQRRPWGEGVVGGDAADGRRQPAARAASRAATRGRSTPRPALHRRRKWRRVMKWA